MGQRKAVTVIEARAYARGNRLEIRILDQLVELSGWTRDYAGERCGGLWSLDRCVPGRRGGRCMVRGLILLSPDTATSVLPARRHRPGNKAGRR